MGRSWHTGMGRNIYRTALSIMTVYYHTTEGHILCHDDGAIMSECCCIEDALSEWTFTDQGFVYGGQAGALRTYNSPGDVSESPWTANSDGLRLDFENDDNCSDQWVDGRGANPNEQIATARAILTLTQRMRLSITWSGMAERQNPLPGDSTVYERMELYIDDDLKGSAHSPGGGYGCSMGPIISSPASPQTVELEAGEHELFIWTSTIDPYFHWRNGTYYIFTLKLEAI